MVMTSVECNSEREGGREGIFFLKAEAAVVLGDWLLGYEKKGMKRILLSEKRRVPAGH